MCLNYFGFYLTEVVLYLLVAEIMIIIPSCIHIYIAKDVYKPEKEPTGFFPPAHTAHQPCESDEERPPIKPDCYVPNSVLLRLLWPQHELEEAKNPEKEYRPPGLTDKQLKQIAALNEKVMLTFGNAYVTLKDKAWCWM